MSARRKIDDARYIDESMHKDEPEKAQINLLVQKVESRIRRGSSSKGLFRSLASKDLCGYQGDLSKDEGILVFKVATVRIVGSTSQSFELRPDHYVTDDASLVSWPASQPLMFLVPIQLQDYQLIEWTTRAVNKWLLKGLEYKPVNGDDDNDDLFERYLSEIESESEESDSSSGSDEDDSSSMSSPSSVSESEAPQAENNKSFIPSNLPNTKRTSSLVLMNAINHMLYSHKRKDSDLENDPNELIDSPFRITVTQERQVNSAVIEAKRFAPFKEKYDQYIFTVVVHGLDNTTVDRVRSNIGNPHSSPTVYFANRHSQTRDDKKMKISWRWIHVDPAHQNTADILQLYSSANKLMFDSKATADVMFNFQTFILGKLAQSKSIAKAEIRLHHLDKLLHSGCHYERPQLRDIYKTNGLSMDQPDHILSPDELKLVFSSLEKIIVSPLSGSESADLTKADWQVVRGLFSACCNVKVRKLTGGFSGSVVLQTISFDIDGRPEDSAIVKLDSAECILQEEERHRMMCTHLGDHAPVILGKFQDESGLRAGLKISLAGEQAILPSSTLSSDKYLVTLKDLYFFEQQNINWSGKKNKAQDMKSYRNRSMKNIEIHDHFVQTFHEETESKEEDFESNETVGGIETTISDIEKSQSQVAAIHNIQSILLEVFGEVFERCTVQSSLLLTVQRKNVATEIYDITGALHKHCLQSPILKDARACNIEAICEAHYSLAPMLGHVLKSDRIAKMDSVLENEQSGIFVDFVLKLDDWLRNQKECISVYSGVVHGDLNAANIVIDHQGVPWVIDFMHSGAKHVLHDILKLLSCIVLEYLDVSSIPQLHAAIRMNIQMATCCSDLSMKIPPEPGKAVLEPLLKSKVDNELKKCWIAKVELAWQTCRILRNYASKYVRDEVDIRQLHAGMLYFSIKALDYKDLSIMQKQLAISSIVIHANQLMKNMSEVPSAMTLEIPVGNISEEFNLHTGKLKRELHLRSYVNKLAMKCSHFVDPVSRDIFGMSETINLDVEVYSQFEDTQQKRITSPTALKTKTKFLQRNDFIVTIDKKNDKREPSKRPRLQLETLSVDPKLNERNSRFFTQVKEVLGIDAVLYSRIAVCGPPSSGKTVLLKKLATFSLEDQDFYRPVYIELNELCKFVRRKLNTDSQEAIRQKTIGGPHPLTSTDKKFVFFKTDDTSSIKSPKHEKYSRRFMSRGTKKSQNLKSGGKSNRPSELSGKRTNTRAIGSPSKNHLRLSSVEESNLLESYWASLYGEQSPIFVMLCDALQENKMVLFLDGVDEMRSSSMNVLLRWLDKKPELLVFVTTRDEKLLKIQSNRFTFLQMCPLKDNHIKGIITKHINRQSVDDEAVAKFVYQECKKPVFKQVISSSPLLVNLVVFALLQSQNKQLSTYSDFEWSLPNILEFVITCMIKVDSQVGNNALDKRTKLCMSPLGLSFIESIAFTLHVRKLKQLSFGHLCSESLLDFGGRFDPIARKHSSEQVIEVCNAISKLVRMGCLSLVRLDSSHHGNLWIDRPCGFSLLVLQEYLVASYIAKNLRALAVSEKDDFENFIRSLAYKSGYKSGPSTSYGPGEEIDILSDALSSTDEESSIDGTSQEFSDDSESNLSEPEEQVQLLNDPWWQPVFFLALKLLFADGFDKPVCSRIFSVLSSQVDDPDYVAHLSRFLRYVARAGDDVLMGYLIEVNVEVGRVENMLMYILQHLESGGNQYNLLQIACRRNHVGVVRLLLEQSKSLSEEERKSFLEQQSVFGETSLTLCAEHGHSKCLDLLVQHGADVHYEHDEEHWNSLYLACYDNHMDNVRLLLKAGADPNFTCDDVSCLYNACFDGNYELCKVLLDNGADPLLKSTDGVSCADVAKQEGHKMISKLLACFIDK